MGNVKHYLNEMTEQYAATMVWVGHDWTRMVDGNPTPLDENYDVSNIDDEAMDRMRSECAAFLDTAWAEYPECQTLEAEQMGHDFALTRNGHGTGFWDRGLGELGDALTELTKPYGESELFPCEDGKLRIA